MARDGEVKQRQHFYHHGDTICHPKSGYVTAKLHRTSTCRCNDNAIFSHMSEEQLELWRMAIENKGLRVSRSKTEYLPPSSCHDSKVKLGEEEI